MKREQIEQLLADHVSGKISPQSRQQLEGLFKSDPTVKKEADEMLALWKLIEDKEDAIPPADMDTWFYATLQRTESDAHNYPIFVNRTWLQLAVAALIGIVTFGIGRFTASPKLLYQDRIVYVKQPIQQVAHTSNVAVIAKTAIAVKMYNLNNIAKGNSTLAIQLRSIYASERMDAVTKITGKANINKQDLEKLELGLKEDPSPNVRMAILNGLQPIASSKNIQQLLINALKHQDNAFVQSSIVDLLIDAKSKQAIPTMIALLDDKNTSETTQNKIKAGIQTF